MTKFLKFKKIRSRLVFWFLLTSFIPLLISLVISYTGQLKVNNLNTFEKLISIRDLKVNQVNKWIDARTGDMHVLAYDYEMEGLDEILNGETFLEGDSRKIRIAEESLKRSLKNYKDYSNIFILSKTTGQIKISTSPEFVGLNKSHELYFSQPMQNKEVYISPITRSQKTQTPEMYMSMPVYGDETNTEPIGVLVAQINLDISLYELLLNRVGLGETGETLIVNEDVVALNELRWFGNAPLKLRITAKPAVYAASGRTGIIKTGDYRGVKVLAAYTYIPRVGWGIICKQDTKELNRPLQKAALNFILILLVAGTIILFITLRFSQVISEPIVQMNSIAQQIRLGNLSQRNKIHSIDELGLLELEFNNMADEIESRIFIQNQIQKISETMLKENEIHDFSENILTLLTDISGSYLGVFYILNEAKSVYEPYTIAGGTEKMFKPFSISAPPDEIAQGIFFKKVNHITDISEKTVFRYNDGGDNVPKEIITLPIVVEGIVVAVILLAHSNKFRKENILVLEQSQVRISMSFSNLLANERTRVLSEQLTLINQQLEEQTEELQDQAEELHDQADELKNNTIELQHQNTLLDIEKKKVEEANKLKSEFLSNMSHELRTPLNSIMALSKILLEHSRNKLSKEESNYLEIIERNGRRLLAIINDILDLSRIEAGKMEVISQKVSIESLLYTTAENLQTLAKEKDLELEVFIPERLPMVITDEFRLHQVLTNIVGNAIKFTEKGEVTISGTYDSEFVNICVKDSGIGISEEMLESIFDEFRQVDGSISRRYEGTGLGLAIAKKIMSILGGSISVKSKLDEGSEFMVRVPLQKQETRTIESYHDTKVKNSSKPNSLKNQGSIVVKEDIRVLLVEDNPETVFQMKDILAKNGYSVIVAENGLEALKVVQDSIPQGIILDLMMPEMNGFEFLEQLRSSEVSKEIPVLILTAKDLDRNEIKKVEKYNVDFAIRKGDIDLKNLFSKIETMLANKGLTEVKENSQTSENRDTEILVVEDNPDNLVTIRALLGDNFMLKEARSGEEGLNLIKEKKPALILLDMSLPKMSGRQFLTLIKNNKEYKNIPVVAVTAQAMKGDKEKFLDSGFDGYVAKPIEIDRLKKEIEKLLK